MKLSIFLVLTLSCTKEEINTLGSDTLINSIQPPTLRVSIPGDEVYIPYSLSSSVNIDTLNSSINIDLPDGYVYVAADSTGNISARQTNVSVLCRCKDNGQYDVNQPKVGCDPIFTENGSECADNGCPDCKTNIISGGEPVYLTAGGSGILDFNSGIYFETDFATEKALMFENAFAIQAVLDSFNLFVAKHEIVAEENDDSAKFVPINIFGRVQILGITSDSYNRLVNNDSIDVVQAHPPIFGETGMCSCVDIILDDVTFPGPNTCEAGTVGTRRGCINSCRSGACFASMIITNPDNPTSIDYLLAYQYKK